MTRSPEDAVTDEPASPPPSGSPPLPPTEPAPTEPPSTQTPPPASSPPAGSPLALLAGRRPSAFVVALLVLFLATTGLRFWGLNRINSLVFDEVYFAVFAEDYRTGKEFFDIAPPLSKYLIAIGISAGLKLESPSDNTNEAVGERMAPFTYRWINALQGSLIVPAIAALAWLLSRDRRFTLLATLLFACDGLYLVDARLALTNTPLVLFGVLAHIAFLLAPRVTGAKRWALVVLAGVLFGASFGTKWNGLGFGAGAGLVWFFAWLTRIARERRPFSKGVSLEPPGPVERLGELSLPSMLVLGVVFALTYYVIWIPHLRIYPKDEANQKGRTFLEWQKAMLDAHIATGGEEAHGYCSKWYTWPFMLRPVAYYYVTDKEPGKNPGDPEVTLVKDIHAIANPIVCWLATIALFGITGAGAWTWGSSYLRWLWARPPPEKPWSTWTFVFLGTASLVLIAAGVAVAALSQGLRTLLGLSWVGAGLFAHATCVALFVRDWQRRQKPPKRKPSPGGALVDRLLGVWLEVVPPANEAAWLAFFLVGNYVVNMLPWIGVKRCLFFYHYMEAYVFAILALAFLVPRWCESLDDPTPVGGWGPFSAATLWHRRGEVVFWIIVAGAVASFVYFLPIFVGLPLTTDAFYQRMWLTRWI